MGTFWPERAWLELSLTLVLVFFVFLTIAFFWQYPNCLKIKAYTLFRTVSRAQMWQKTADWPSLSSRHFVLRYEPGTDSEMARLVLLTAEEYYGPVKELLGGQPLARIPLVVYRDRQSLRAGFGWGPEESAMGVYWAGVVRILSPSDWVAAAGPREMAAVFRRDGPVAHELAHLFVDYRAGGNYPRWLTEGIAQQVERAVTGFVFHPAAGEEEVGWYPLAALDREFDALPDQELAYRQSLLLTDYLAATYGPGSLQALLDVLGQGRTFNQALRQVAGISAEQLEAGFRAWTGAQLAAQQAATTQE